MMMLMMVMMKMITTPMELKYRENMFDDCANHSRSPGRGSRSRKIRTRRPTCPSCSYGAAPAKITGGVLSFGCGEAEIMNHRREKHTAAENGGLQPYQAFIKHNMQNGTKN